MLQSLVRQERCEMGEKSVQYDVLHFCCYLEHSNKPLKLKMKITVSSVRDFFKMGKEWETLVIRKGAILLIGVQLSVIQGILLVWHSCITLAQPPKKIAVKST